MTKLSASLAVLGLIGVATAVPAAASTINLNTGNGANPYTIASDTLSPSEGTTVFVVTNLGGGWINNLSSEWIAPAANQSNKSQADVGGVTYDVMFSLPVGFTGGSLSITLAADDWAQISLNGNSSFYTGPTTGQWTFDTVVPISSTVNGELLAGTNTLQFFVGNTGTGGDAGGGPTGLDAQVSVSFTPASGTPEPATTVPLALLGLGGGFALYRRRQVSN